MNSDQFNAKWKSFLEKGHYGMSLDRPEVNEYLDQRFEEWSKIPGFQYAQIKMKYDWARVYVDNVPTEEIRKAEEFIESIYNHIP